jgi:hypothetical protein
MNAQNPLTLPIPEQPREIRYCLRLTLAERTRLNQLAKQLNLPTAVMVRHFLFQAVEFYSRQQGEPEAALEA